MKQLIFIFSIFVITISSVIAQTTPVANYTFSQHVGTYTEISGGTVHGTEANVNESFNAIDLGFTFNYNATNYTQISIQTNGFIAMGTSVSSNSYPVSSSSGTDNVIVPFGRSILAQTGSELMSKMEGTAPNRVFTVQ